jgi:hypothetical protein
MGTAVERMQELERMLADVEPRRRSERRCTSRFGRSSRWPARSLVERSDSLLSVAQKS